MKKMKAKLYKTEKENYVLVDPTKGTYDDGYTLGTSRESQFNKLSIKNCETIERGYDLDELVEDNFQGLRDCIEDKDIAEFYIDLVKTVITELLGDKKFSINEVVELCKILMSNPFETCGKTYQELTDSYIQSLQQTEWEVEVEKENVMHDYNGNISLGAKFKLDADGCLILKL